MLGPFRIRHLSRPPSPPGHRPFPRTAPRISARDAIVSLTGNEYDKTVTDHPESKLKYVDEDDGEVVTVGSQLELSQRLQEPVPLSSKIRPTSVIPTASRSNSIGSLMGPEPRALESSMHVFEVDPVESARLVWEEIEMRTKEQVDEFSATDNQPGLSNIEQADMYSASTSPPAHVDDNELASTSEALGHAHAGETRAKIESWRARRAIRRNRLFSQGERPFYEPSSPPRYGSRMKLADVLNDVEPEVSAEETWPLLKKSRSHFLTPEGKRQAKEAGIKLRQRLTSNLGTGSRDFSEVVADGKRWASYSGNDVSAIAPPTQAKSAMASTATKKLQGEVASDKDQASPLPPLLPSLRVDTDGKLQADGYEENSLFESFRAELAKLGQSSNQQRPFYRKDVAEGEVSKSKSDSKTSAASQQGTEASLLSAPPPYTRDLESPAQNKQSVQSATTLDSRSVQVSISKMLMTTLASISTSMSLLNSEIQRDVMPNLEGLESIAAEGSKDHVAMKHSLKCFEEEVMRIVELLNLVQTQSETFPAGSGRLNLFNMTTAASTVKSFGEAINRLHKSLYSTCSPTDNEVMHSVVSDVPKHDQSDVWKFMMRPIPKWAGFREVQYFIEKTLKDACHPDLAVHDVRINMGSPEALTAAFFEVIGEQNACEIEGILNEHTWAGERLSVKKGLVRATISKPKTGNPSPGTASKEEIPQAGPQATPNALRNVGSNRAEIKAKRQSVRFEDPPSCPVVRKSESISELNSHRVKVDNGYRYVPGRTSHEPFKSFWTESTTPKVLPPAISEKSLDSARIVWQRESGKNSGLKDDFIDNSVASLHDRNQKDQRTDRDEASRGRQSVRASPSDRSLPYEYIVSPPERIVPKRRSMPPIISRQRSHSFSLSRSRSRSPSRSPITSYSRDRFPSPQANARLRRARSVRFHTADTSQQGSWEPVVKGVATEPLSDKRGPATYDLKPQWWERKPWWHPSPNYDSYEALGANDSLESNMTNYPDWFTPHEFKGPKSHYDTKSSDKKTQNYAQESYKSKGTASWNALAERNSISIPLKKQTANQSITSPPTTSRDKKPCPKDSFPKADDTVVSPWSLRFGLPKLPPLPAKELDTRNDTSEPISKPSSSSPSGMKKDNNPPVTLRKRFSVPSFVRTPPQEIVSARNAGTPARVSSMRPKPRPSYDGAYDGDHVQGHLQPRASLSKAKSLYDLNGEPGQVQPWLQNYRKTVCVPASSTAEYPVTSCTKEETGDKRQTQFPTLEEFESSRNSITDDLLQSTSEPRFPPLPSMEPLIPLRPKQSMTELKDQKIKLQNTPKVGIIASPAPETPEVSFVPKTPSSDRLLQSTKPTSNETSGEFFSRMVGRSSPQNQQSWPPMEWNFEQPDSKKEDQTAPSTQQPVVSPPTDRPAPPPYFDPAIRRSATVSGSNGKSGSATLRRPYSQVFDGKGRVEWDNFLRNPRPAPIPGSIDATPSRRATIIGARRPAEGTTLQSTAPQPLLKQRAVHFVPVQGFTNRATPAQSEPIQWHPNQQANIRWHPFNKRQHVQAPPPFDSGRFSTESPPPAHENPKTVGKIQECVDQLRSLGYGKNEDGGHTRLVVYAQAADGEVGDAVDLIEEERLAWGERSA